MQSALATFVVLASFATAGLAQETEHRLGEHPAVLVKRAEAKQTYDYQAQFYPHPAWLYLAAEAPHPMMDHPAVIVAKRERDAAAAWSAAVAVQAQIGATVR